MNENFNFEKNACDGALIGPLMRIDIMTLFPDSMNAVLGESI